MLAVTGDFASTEMVAKLQAAFGDWTPQEVNFPDVATSVYDPRPAVYLAPKDVEQTTLMLGHLGIKSDNADYAAVTVLDLVLGSGGFSSRLYQHIRNDLGLAYSVGSHFGAGLRDYGAFMIYCATGNENVGAALQAILDEIRDVREREVGAEELRAAKNQYLNSFVFKFATVDDVVQRQMLYAYLDYPADFLTTFRERVLNVTAADIQRAAQTYLHPESLTILAVGAADQIRPVLAKFGDVQELTLDSVE